MLARRAPTIALVLTVLLAPSATAFGDDLQNMIDSGTDPLRAWIPLDPTPLLPETSPLTPDEHEEIDRAPHARPVPAHESREAEEERAAEPRRESAPGLLAPLAPVTRMLPVPNVGAGPVPRIDLGAILGPIDPLAPLAPAPVAASASSPSAPVAPLATSATPQNAPAPLALELAAFTAVAAAAASAPAASLLWERLRRFGFLALLYSRIAKERLLDHSARERLIETIRAHPGLAVADLAAKTGAPRNTVTYHLRVLEREQLVHSTRNGRSRLFFAPGSLVKRDQADALVTLRHETSLALARAIGATPGVDQKALCERVGVSPSLAHWHADRLVAAGLVDKRREGRNVRYYPGAAYDLVRG